MGNRKVGFIQVMHDMLEDVGYWFLLIVIVSFPVVLFLVLYYDIAIDPEKLPETLENIVPEIMGFLIAGLAIIMGFNEGTLKRLSKKANDEEVPIKVIIASFSVCLLILLATLIVSTMYANITFTCTGCSKLLSVFVLYGAVISVESIIHVIFHLYATGTFLVIK